MPQLFPGTSLIAHSLVLIFGLVRWGIRKANAYAKDRRARSAVVVQHNQEIKILRERVAKIALMKTVFPPRESSVNAAEQVRIMPSPMHTFKVSPYIPFPHGKQLRSKKVVK